MKWADISAMLVFFSCALGACVGTANAESNWRGILAGATGGLVLGFLLASLSGFLSYRLLRTGFRRDSLNLTLYLLSPVPCLLAALLLGPIAGHLIALAFK